MINDCYQSELITIAIVLCRTGALVGLFITSALQRGGKSSIVFKMTGDRGNQTFIAIFDFKPKIRISKSNYMQRFGY